MNHEVGSRARKALVEMGQKAATNEVINKLLSLLDHTNVGVRMSACDILGEIGERAATDEVINKLLILLDDRDDSVISKACYALAKMGEKAMSHEVINRLSILLDDRDPVVRRHACDALAKMGKKVATDEVINRLSILLVDRDRGVRRCACDALAKMGEKAAIDEVIKKLLIRLSDMNDQVTIMACEALKNMVLIDNAIAALSSIDEQSIEISGDTLRVFGDILLESPNTQLRCAAKRALENISKNQQLPKIISDILKLEQCGQALHERFENAKGNEFVQKLLIAAKDRQQYLTGNNFRDETRVQDKLVEDYLLFVLTTINNQEFIGKVTHELQNKVNHLITEKEQEYELRVIEEGLNDSEAETNALNLQWIKKMKNTAIFSNKDNLSLGNFASAHPHPHPPNYPNLQQLTYKLNTLNSILEKKLDKLGEEQLVESIKILNDIAKYTSLPSPLIGNILKNLVNLLIQSNNDDVIVNAEYTIITIISSNEVDISDIICITQILNEQLNTNIVEPFITNEALVNLGKILDSNDNKAQHKAIYILGYPAECGQQLPQEVIESLVKVLNDTNDRAIQAVELNIAEQNDEIEKFYLNLNTFEKANNYTVYSEERDRILELLTEKKKPIPSYFDTNQ
ncbi:unnamed protein product [Didymodactylos carnosus]|uniref:Uncharacterized protein n=2 Tax=Didymodactylos carnosus TaxID=1234261 RepID=A0A815KC16_9BILA|nr:unnamed protein product [Didymodactylos carnosus]CAF4285408.1 unnamed protein product [Didymodactylos carnosus]